MFGYTQIMTLAELCYDDELKIRCNKHLPTARNVKKHRVPAFFEASEVVSMWQYVRLQAPGCKYIPSPRAIENTEKKH